MKTTLRTDITIEELCKGFVFNELEEKGLYGLSGTLTIQPEYQPAKHARGNVLRSDRMQSVTAYGANYLR